MYKNKFVSSLRQYPPRHYYLQHYLLLNNSPNLHSFLSIQKSQGNLFYYFRFAEYSINDEETPSTSTSTLCGDETNANISLARAAPTRSFVLPARDRQVVLLPYVDIGLPDWKTHELPQQERFFFPEPADWTSKSLQSRQ